MDVINDPHGFVYDGSADVDNFSKKGNYEPLGATRSEYYSFVGDDYSPVGFTFGAIRIYIHLNSPFRKKAGGRSFLAKISYARSYA